MVITFSRISDFPGGWFAGAFSPSLLPSSEFEVGLKRFAKGQGEVEHYQEIATEVTLVVEGTCLLAGRQLSEGDIAVIPPGVSASFEALSDVILVVVKTPSIPSDKIIGEAGISYG